MDGRLTADILWSSIVNCAMEQNRLPLIQRLTLRNAGEEPLSGLQVKLEFEPAFAAEWSCELPFLPAGERVQLDLSGLRLSGEFLAALPQQTEGKILLSADGEEGELLRESCPVTLLSPRQWPGRELLPELTAAYVLPGDPGVGELLADGRKLLAGWGAEDFAGYRSQSSGAVLLQAKAVYEAIRARKLALAEAGEHFPQARPASALLAGGEGSTLEFTLLSCACLEAAGLHPLVIFEEETVSAGCWLEERRFAESIQDDLPSVWEPNGDRTAEILLFDAAAAARGQEDSFEEACALACGRVLDGSFLFLLDISRARAGGIAPLSGEGGQGDARPRPAPEPVLSRQQLWERRLLDLSLRNMLINFRVTRSALQLITPDCAALADALAAGTEFRVAGCPEEWKLVREERRLFRLDEDQPEIPLIAASELEAGLLHAFLPEQEVAPAMTYLYRQARLSLEENGSNTLYLAVGLLKWYESELSEKPRYAPLVLLPVEIVRKTPPYGYVVRMRDEESQMNITLLEMLRQDFGISIPGLDPLPHDRQGADLEAVFSAVRRATAGQPRWDIEKRAFLGLFSFSQFIMWSDIRNRAEDLKRNKIVRSLMSGRMEWTPDGEFPAPERLDEEYRPADMAVPITADASQLAAICAAGQGRSFVLHGPPGTGKSQTITNIIANALYHGKSVLFLAEKMAALSVVQKRLEKIGLGPFALELHSNKAKKRDVLAQLQQALAIGHIRPAEDYEEQAERLYALRQELNAYVAALHRQRPCGFSAWEAITRYEASLDAPADICFLPEEVEGLTARTVQVWEDIAEEMQAAAIACGGPAGHPLREWQLSAYSSSVRSELGSRLAAFGESIARTQSLLDSFCGKLGLPADGSARYLAGIVDFARQLRENSGLPACLVTGGELSPLREELDELCGGGRRRDAAREALLITYQKEILLFNEPTARREWEQASDSWILPRIFGQNKVLKSLRALAKDPKSLLKEQVESGLNLLAEYDEGTRIIAGKERVFAARFGPLWKEREPDWRILEQSFEKGCRLQEAAAGLADSPEARRELLTNAARCYLSNRTGPDDAAGAELGALVESFAEMKREAERIWSLGRIRTAQQEEGGQLALLRDRQRRWGENLSLLRGWCSWIAAEQRAVGEGLRVLAAACRSGAVEPEQLMASYHRGLYAACADAMIESEPALSGFHGEMFEAKVRKFRRMSSDFEQLTRRELVARLSARIPAPSAGIAASSETGILQKAIRSGGRALSIRRLFDSIPNLLRLLCPCMLMSPISVAQYIDPQYPPFDLVIFDEASQLPTCEAVGAIARGENVIVVGDPKQLPPTAFFTNAPQAGEDFEQEDLESILDDCLAISMPEEHLLWHYRSRHESLIAFSNRQYYGNLYTFPSPCDLESKVSLVPVGGSYDRGRSKQNRAEAEAVVGEILRRLSDDRLAKESIGVVTFSAVQQNLIEDLLLEAFAEHPGLEEKNAAAEEPIFVKNLENVQGDERDVILFSIGYGPDEDGRVALNFGPLNREGGWRRLNVAVSRARREMKVYSTLRASQIDLSRTRAEGVAGLKAFLEFAEKGYAALATPAQELSVQQDPFAELLASHVRRLGYEVRTHVGCSAFRIDLAVVDPRYPGEYLLGILCDGNSYKAGKTARDRNMNQESVLRSLGWKLHHVWVLEWREDPVREIGRIRDAIENALRQERQAPLPPPEERRPPELDQARFEREPEPEEKRAPYVVCKLPERPAGVEEFCLPEHDGEILAQMKQVLEAEAPVSGELLCRRVMNAWGITRMTAKVERRFAPLLEKLPGSQTRWEDRTFYWSRRRGPRKYADFRVPGVPGADDFRRDAEDIPPEEFANAVRYVLERQISLPKEDLVREVYRLFGFQRTGSVIAGAAEAGLRAAVRRGCAAEDEGRFVLPQG